MKPDISLSCFLSKLIIVVEQLFQVLTLRRFQSVFLGSVHLEKEEKKNLAKKEDVSVNFIHRPWIWMIRFFKKKIGLSLYRISNTHVGHKLNL